MQLNLDVVTIVFKEYEQYKIKGKMEVKWINHGDRKILLIDYTGIIVERGMIALTSSIPSFLDHLGKEEDLFSLVDLTGCFVTPGFLDAAKRLEKEILNNYKGKRAILGITGPKVILLKGYNLIAKHKLIPFDDRAEALDFLSGK